MRRIAGRLVVGLLDLAREHVRRGGLHQHADLGVVALERTDPPRDVFFSVPDLATAAMCWDGSITRRLDEMLNTEPDRAQNNIRAAMRASRARFHVMYPDGVDHLHINVTKYPNIIEMP